jgi:hypothetical protein
MKIYIDFEDGQGEQLAAEYDATIEKLLKDQIGDDVFQEDMKRRLGWVMTQKIAPCAERLKETWKDTIKSRYEFMPTDDTKLIELIFAQPDYKTMRELAIIQEEERQRLIAEKAAAELNQPLEEK